MSTWLISVLLTRCFNILIMLIFQSTWLLILLCFVALFYSPKLFCLAYISHIFDKTIKSFQKKEYYSYSSQSDAVDNKHTMYVYSSHATVDLILIAVDQKDRSLEFQSFATHIIILKPIALQSQ